MKTTTKKIVSVLLVLSMMLVMVLTSCGGESDGDRDAFIDGIGGVSETYEGAVSQESYETAEEAATAFVEEELAGESNATVTEVTKQGELDEGEISSTIPEYLREGITSVEEYEVTYSIDDSSSYVSSGEMQVQKLSTDTLNKTQKVKVYVIKYGVDWKYFSPMPENGSTISKSYYDSVFNGEKYKNSTFKYDMTMNYEIAADGLEEPMDLEMTVSQLIKHADNKVYLEQKITYGGSMGEMMGGTMDEMGLGDIYAYLEEDENGNVVCYVKLGSDSTEWNETELYSIGFSSIDDLTPFATQYLDYTYFTKTEYGFALEAENAAQYVAQTLEALDAMGIVGNDGIEMFAEYYVSEGVLSGMRMDMDINIDMSQSGVSMQMTGEATGNMTCVDYGTTVVEKPFTE